MKKSTLPCQHRVEIELSFGALYASARTTNNTSDIMSDTQKQNQGNREGSNRRPRNNRNRNRNRNNRNRAPKPLKLTFWQKVLKAIGLFDEEKARKQQQQQRNATKQPKTATATPKTNVPNAKSKTSDKPQGKQQNKQPRRAPQPVTVDSARLYVGNLSYDATEMDIEELFKGVGTVKRVEIIYNRNTHKSKGYGFVQMLNTEEALRAVEVLHDQPFLGRQLVVNGSKSRKTESAPKSEETITTEE